MCLRVLASMADSPVAMGHERSNEDPRANSKGRRKLSVFELARLKRDIQIATSGIAGAELLRQVLWSIEAGALRRFSPLHAAHIALKKIREGAWTRPHRMPPNWSPADERIRSHRDLPCCITNKDFCLRS